MILLDAHVHFWDPGRLGYPWLSALPSLDRALGPAEYRAATRPAAVAGVVLVQAGCEPPHAEVEWALELAAADPLVAAVVAHAPLEDGDEVIPHLELLAGSPLVRAVRRMLAFDDDVSFCLAPAFLRATRALGVLGLGFELLVSPRQLGVACELAARCPDVRFVLDHAGNPDVRGGGFEPWRTDLARLAAHPNVWCKLSGLATQADHGGWTAAALRPYIECAVESFGWDRVMFGSDWPIVTQAASFGRWLSALLDGVGQPGPDALDRLLWRTACAFYRIDPGLLLR